MTNAEASQHDKKMRAEIVRIAAQTTKLNRDFRWYQAVFIAVCASAVTIGLIALTKIFL